MFVTGLVHRGNPRGRRKGQRNLAPVLAEVLSQTITVRQEGNAQRMSKGEALIKILLAMAQKGDSRAIKVVLELSEKIGRIQNAQIRRTRKLLQIRLLRWRQDN
jgi:hypothetical protein